MEENHTSTLRLKAYNPLGKKNIGESIVKASDSVSAASDLRLCDFTCRYLAVDDIWMPLAETLLIEKFQPVWHIAVDGFGNHDPGKGRHDQKRSAWDTLHPGRDWAKLLRQCPVTAMQSQERTESFIHANHAKETNRLWQD